MSDAFISLDFNWRLYMNSKAGVVLENKTEMIGKIYGRNFLNL
jgi:hypothetical protein